MEKNILPEVLNLRGNKLTSSSLTNLIRYIRFSTSLKSLSLEWNLINDKLLLSEFLANLKLSSLVTLDLNNNKIKYDCQDVFVNFIHDNRVLLSLDLSWNDLTNGFGIRILDIFDHDTTLIKLGLSGNGIDPKIIDQIEAKLVKNGHIQNNFAEKMKKIESIKYDFSRNFDGEKLQKSEQRNYGVDQMTNNFKTNNQFNDSTNFEATRMTSPLYEALKNDLIKEKTYNNELLTKLNELSKQQNENNTDKETSEMK